jgi:hypothetical protein
MAKLMQPNTFLRSGEGALASYSYTDLADGTGVVVLYAGQVNPVSAADAHILSAQQFYSEAVEVTGTTTFNFDLTAFNSPRIAKGTAYLNFGVFQTSSSSNISLTVKLQKNVAGSFTDISSTITAKMPTGNGGHKMCMVPIPVTTTAFKIGEALRMVVVWTDGTASSAIGIDPMGRYGPYITSALTAPTISTVMKLLMPFKLNL